jgi:lactam utilization protein B
MHHWSILVSSDTDAQFRAWKADEVKRHIQSQVYNASVTAVSGETIELPLGTYPVSLCCHSDSPGCVEIVQAARQIVDDFNTEHFSQRSL